MKEHPSISLSTLAKAMGPTSPATLAKLLRGHKYAMPGPRRAYQNARRQAIDLLVDEVPLEAETTLRKHEREVIEALKRAPVQLPAWTRAVRPSRETAPWTVHGVRVSMQPDVELDGRKESGALKFSFTKERLAPTVGSAMAALMWKWRAQELGAENVDPAHCLVYEPRLPWLHRPGRRPERQLESVELACRTIAALWPVI